MYSQNSWQWISLLTSTSLLGTIYYTTSTNIKQQYLLSFLTLSAIFPINTVVKIEEESPKPPVLYILNSLLPLWSSWWVLLLGCSQSFNFPLVSPVFKSISNQRMKIICSFTTIFIVNSLILMEVNCLLPMGTFIPNFFYLIPRFSFTTLPDLQNSWCPDSWMDAAVA